MRRPTNTAAEIKHKRFASGNHHPLNHSSSFDELPPAMLAGLVTRWRREADPFKLKHGIGRAVIE